MPLNLPHIVQVNKFNKSAERGVVITDKFIYKLDVKKKFKPMAKGIPLTDVSEKLLLIKFFS